MSLGEQRFEPVESLLGLETLREVLRFLEEVV
jgi:hypothetical protein